MGRSKAEGQNQAGGWRQAGAQKGARGAYRVADMEAERRRQGTGMAATAVAAVAAGALTCAEEVERPI